MTSIQIAWNLRDYMALVKLVYIIDILHCLSFKFSISFGSDLRHIRFGSDIFFTIYPDLFPV